MGMMVGNAFTTTLTRPERDDELAIEAASRERGGPLAYRGTRDCSACEADAEPVHPSGTDRQVCGNCLAALPGTPVTWSVRDDPDGGHPFLILRRGDYVIAHRAPVSSGDDEVDTIHAANAWLKLERDLGLGR